MIQILILCNKSCRVKSLLNKCNSLAQNDAVQLLDGKLRGNYGDYVVIRQMAMFMDPVQFNKVIELVINMGSRTPNESVNVSSA